MSIFTNQSSSRSENLGPRLTQLNIENLHKNRIFKSDDEQIMNSKMPSSSLSEKENIEIDLKKENDGISELGQKNDIQEENPLAKKRSGLFTVQQLLFSNYSKKKSTVKNTSDKILKTILFRQKIHRFVDNLRSNAGFLEIRKAPNHALELLNDLSYHPPTKWIENKLAGDDEFEKGLLYRGLNEIWAGYNEKIPIFRPLARIKLLWDCLMLILIVWNLISLSILASFTVEPWECYSFTVESLHSQETFMKFQTLTMALFFFDKLIKFNTGCFENGTEIRDKSKIIWHYLKGGLIYDILGVSPLAFYVFLANEEFKKDKYLYVFWLFLFKIQPLLIFMDNLKQGLFLFEGKKEAFFQLIKLLFQVFIICHCLACIWHVSSKRDSLGKSWVTVQNLQYVEWDQRYLKAIYYIVVTMTTTGYGDIIPQNNLEIILSIFCMFLGSVIVGYSINSIGMILEGLEADSKVSRKKMQIINSFMRKKNINYDIQVKIRKYLDYIWGEGSEQEKKSQEILKELPSFLKNEVLIHSHGHLLKRNQIFSKNFSEETLNSLAVIMKQIHFSPDEWIYMEDDINDEGIYIVSSGVVELIAHCEKKNTRLPPLAIRTEKFCMIRDQITILKSLAGLHSKCLACNQEEHQIISCPLVSYQPNREIKLQRFIYSDQQKRNKHFVRKTVKKKGPFANPKRSRESAMLIREKLDRDREFIEEENSNLDSSPFSSEGQNRNKYEDKEDRLLQEFENKSPVLGTQFEFDMAEEGQELKNRTYLNMQHSLQEESEDILNIYAEENNLSRPRRLSYLNTSGSYQNVYNQPALTSVGNQLGNYQGKSLKLKPLEIVDPQIVKAEETPQFKSEQIGFDKFSVPFSQNILRGFDQVKNPTNEDFHKMSSVIRKSASADGDYQVDLLGAGTQNPINPSGKRDDTLTEKRSITSKQNTATRVIKHNKLFDSSNDRNHSWEVYFPHNNVENVIRNLRIRCRSNKSLRNKSAHFKKVSAPASPRRRKIKKFDN